MQHISTTKSLFAAVYCSGIFPLSYIVYSFYCRCLPSCRESRSQKHSSAHYNRPSVMQRGTHRNRWWAAYSSVSPLLPLLDSCVSNSRCFWCAESAKAAKFFCYDCRLGLKTKHNRCMMEHLAVEFLFEKNWNMSRSFSSTVHLCSNSRCTAV